jgi:hypothetical protein
MPVDLSRNSVACSRSVAIKFKKTIEALDKTAWNKAKAGRLPGMDRVTLNRKMQRYNLTEDTPDVKALRMTQKSCNASVTCNTPFIQANIP